MNTCMTMCLNFQLSKLEFEGIYHPTPLLKLLHTCATNRRYYPTAFILYFSYSEFSVMDHALIFENFIESDIFHFINSFILMCLLFHYWIFFNTFIYWVLLLICLWYQIQILDFVGKVPWHRFDLDPHQGSFETSKCQGCE